MYGDFLDFRKYC